MERGEPVAIGWSVHTGWAACVVAAGSLRAPRVVAREEIELLGDPDRFVFHRAAEGERARAEEAIARATKTIEARAREELERVVGSLRADWTVVASAIVAKTGPMPTPLDTVLAAHPRLHTAEGCLYRDAIAHAAEAMAIASSVIAPKDLVARAAKVTRVAEGDVVALLSAAGKSAGKPWAKDQKDAALAAWVALSAPRSS